ncbi:MAG: hypothetical protein JRJ79_03775 [Deltaproteobacteria bacterium]|nr:hypothetical protein [Deltaproteobacteria bacterium]
MLSCELHGACGDGRRVPALNPPHVPGDGRRVAGRPELATRMPTPEAALSLCAGTRLPAPRSPDNCNASTHGNGGQVSGNGGQAPGALHHIIARGIERR